MKMLVYMNVPGDGNCFYHSLLYLVSEEFRSMSPLQRENYIFMIKDLLSLRFTRKYYDKHLKHLDRSYEDMFREIKYNTGSTSHYVIPFIMELFSYNLIIIDGNGKIIPDVTKYEKGRECICIKYHKSHYEPVALYKNGIKLIFGDISEIQ